MKITHLSLLGAAIVASGCGDDATPDLLLEDATFAAALAEDDGEPLDTVPDGDATEAADETVGDEEAAPIFERDCSLAGVRSRVIATYDTDGDGELDRTERQALADDFGATRPRLHRIARRHLLVRLRWIYDADASRSLDDEERAALRSDLEARCEARQALLLERFDANADGTLDESEWAAARDAIIARRQARREAIMATYDTNGNGVLDDGERLELRADLVAQFQERRAAFIAQFDANGDGMLEGSEREAARAELRRIVRGEYLGQ